MPSCVCRRTRWHQPTKLLDPKVAFRMKAEPMPQKRIQLALVIGAHLVAVVMTTVALAQGSGSSRATPTPPKQPTVDEFATSLWQFINREKAPYRHWASTAAVAVEGIESPHGADGNVYFNDVAVKDWKQVPFNSVLVREKYDTDGKTLLGVSVLYRVKGSAPKNGDWYWLEFKPSGALAKTPAKEGNKPIAGQVASCVACHRKAPGNDFVFSNDKAPVAEADK